MGQPEFSVGDEVLYTRGSVLQPARVVSVDRSLSPPSYGVDLGGGRVRETEAARLRPLEAPLAPQLQPASQAAAAAAAPEWAVSPEEGEEGEDAFGDFAAAAAAEEPPAPRTPPQAPPAAPLSGAWTPDSATAAAAPGAVPDLSQAWSRLGRLEPRADPAATGRLPASSAPAWQGEGSGSDNGSDFGDFVAESGAQGPGQQLAWVAEQSEEAHTPAAPPAAPSQQPILAPPDGTERAWQAWGSPTQGPLQPAAAAAAAVGPEWTPLWNERQEASAPAAGPSSAPAAPVNEEPSSWPGAPAELQAATGSGLPGEPWNPALGALPEADWQLDFGEQPSPVWEPPQPAELPQSALSGDRPASPGAPLPLEPLPPPKAALPEPEAAPSELKAALPEPWPAWPEKGLQPAAGQQSGSGPSWGGDRIPAGWGSLGTGRFAEEAAGVEPGGEAAAASEPAEEEGSWADDTDLIGGWADWGGATTPSEENKPASAPAAAAARSWEQQPGSSPPAGRGGAVSGGAGEAAGGQAPDAAGEPSSPGPASSPHRLGGEEGGVASPHGAFPVGASAESAPAAALDWAAGTEEPCSRPPAGVQAQEQPEGDAGQGPSLAAAQLVPTSSVEASGWTSGLGELGAPAAEGEGAAREVQPDTAAEAGAGVGEGAEEWEWGPDLSDSGPAGDDPPGEVAAPADDLSWLTPSGAADAPAAGPGEEDVEWASSLAPAAAGATDASRAALLQAACRVLEQSRVHLRPGLAGTPHGCEHLLALQRVMLVACAAQRGRTSGGGPQGAAGPQGPAPSEPCSLEAPWARCRAVWSAGKPLVPLHFLLPAKAMSNSSGLEGLVQRAAVSRHLPHTERVAACLGAWLDSGARGQPGCGGGDVPSEGELCALSGVPLGAAQGLPLEPWAGGLALAPAVYLWRAECCQPAGA